MLAITIKKTVFPNYSLGFLSIYAGFTIWIIIKYFLWDANLYLGLLLAPYICTINQQQKSLRYFVPTLLAVALAFLMPVKTMLFLAILFAVLLLIENAAGKISVLLLFLMVLISPVFKHITRLAEFPIRLWLSEQVATFLSLTGNNALASGNQILLDNYEFSVDPACAGLNMLVTSLIIYLFVLAYYQRQLEKQLSFLTVFFLALITILLNIACNFFRILLLVTFKIMPGTFLHDFMGIACLIIYVILPLLGGIKPLLYWLGKNKDSNKSDWNNPDS
ncbi:MAG: exosortase N, partial [Sphingobacteriaceae bacterium]